MSLAFIVFEIFCLQAYQVRDLVIQDGRRNMATGHVTHQFHCIFYSNMFDVTIYDNINLLLNWNNSILVNSLLKDIFPLKMCYKRYWGFEMESILACVSVQTVFVLPDEGYSLKIIPGWYN